MAAPRSAALDALVVLVTAAASARLVPRDGLFADEQRCFVRRVGELMVEPDHLLRVIGVGDALAIEVERLDRAKFIGRCEQLCPGVGGNGRIAKETDITARDQRHLVDRRFPSTRDGHIVKGHVTLV